jgi:alpha-amylase
MRTITLVLIVHDHQPVGNFDEVFERCVRRRLRSFLAFLRAPIRACASRSTQSGPLLQWIALHRRDYLERSRCPDRARREVEPWGRRIL